MPSNNSKARRVERKAQAFHRNEHSAVFGWSEQSRSKAVRDLPPAKDLPPATMPRNVKAARTLDDRPARSRNYNRHGK